MYIVHSEIARSAGEQPTDRTWAQHTLAEDESYRAAALDRMFSATNERESMRSPDAERLKAGTWRVATDVLAQTPHLESHLHAVESLSLENRGHPTRLIAIRFVFTNKLSKDARLLLGFDALVLSGILGRDVSHGKLIHGDNYAVLNVNTQALAVEVQKHIETITGLLSNPSPPDLVLIPHCAECEFQTRCRQKATENDDLSLLSGMTEKERRNLHNKGLFTVTQLSYTFRPRRRPKRLRSKPEQYRHSLRALAVRQKKVHLIGNPEIKT
jgi:predicted RecB family nuclease